MISSAAQALSRELSPSANLCWVDNRPAIHAAIDGCFEAVNLQVEKEGGSVCFGWRILDSGFMVEAEFHAVWVDSEERFLDITPHGPPVRKILFLPDPNRRYEGRQVNNVRRAISLDPRVKAFIEACDAEFELSNRGERQFIHGEIRIRGEEASELDAIRARKVALLEGILASRPKPGRNESCFCGSGEKFKRCCGQ